MRTRSLKKNSNKSRGVRKNKTKKRNKKTKKLIRGGDRAHIVMYKVYEKDDDTMNNNNNKNRCMCVDYRKEGTNKFSVLHNQNLHRCNNQKKKGSDFCEEHQNCMGFVKQFLSGYEPKYTEEELAYWKHPYIEGSHNCYAFFLNQMTKTLKDKCHQRCLKKHKTGCPKKLEECRDFIPQPGDFALLRKYGDLKKKERKYTCPRMEKKIMSDNPGLTKVNFNDKCKPNHYKGSMVVDTDHTFHFYRQNSDGTWSHKPGTLPVTNLDANKKPIYIPHFANRDYSEGRTDSNEINYNDFCGYYCIPNTKFAVKTQA